MFVGGCAAGGGTMCSVTVEGKSAATGARVAMVDAKRANEVGRPRIAKAGKNKQFRRKLGSVKGG